MEKEEEEEKEQINEGTVKERELFEESSTKGKVGSGGEPLAVTRQSSAAGDHWTITGRSAAILVD